MSETKEIECEYTDEIVCPYCGYESGDSWEISADSGDDVCPDCDKKFHYERNVTVDYSTSKIY